MSNLKLMSLGAGLLLVAACSGNDVANLKSLAISGDGYDAALAREYKDFALYEADQMGDMRDADRFALKAVAAAKGDRPGPEDLRTWNLPDTAMAELLAARKRLVSSLNDTSRDQWPEQAAKALSRFDCWVEQLDENFQPGHIAACRTGFYAAMFEAENPLPHAFISFFDLNDATPKGDGAEAAAGVIRKAISGETASAVNAIGAVRVLIGGHADRSGTPSHNYRLSLKRAENIRDRLIMLGVPAARISVHAHGESLPIVVTPDGIPELKNRRVEININLAQKL